MAVDITGEDGSLFWKAGIDTSDLDSGMQKVTDAIQVNIKKQADIQQQAAASSKQMAQTILQSVASLNGLDSGLNKQAAGLASFGSGLKTLSSQVGQYVGSIETQLAGLEGESIDITGRVESKPLLDALTLLKSEINVLNSDTISIHAGAVDVQPLLTALDTVQKEYDKFSQKTLSIAVTADTSGLNGLSNTLSQTSVDAFKSHRQDITQAIAEYKKLQTEGGQALDSVAQHVHHAHGAVEEMDHAMHDMSEHAGHDMHEMATDIAEVVQATNQGTVSLRQMADAVKGQTGSWQQLNTAFHGIFHGKSGDASLGAQWQQIKAGKITLSEFIENLKLSDAQLQKLPTALEKAGYVAKGTFAGMAGEAQAASGSVAQFSKEVTQSIQALETKLKTLEGHSLSLNTKGVDTTAFNNSLSGLKSQFIDIKTGKVDVSSVEAALKTIEADMERLSGQSIELRVKSIDTASVTSAFEELKKKIASVNQSAIDLKISGVDTASLTQSLERARAEFDRLKGLTLSADINTEEFQKAYERLQQEVAALEGNAINLRVAGVDTREVEAELSGLREKLNLPQVTLSLRTGSISEKTRELEALKQKYQELSAVDRNSDIGKTMVKNIQQAEAELEDINKAFLKIDQHAAGSLNEKVAQLQRLKDQYAALSGADRNSTIGRGMARDIHNLDTEIQKVNGEFTKTESLIQKAGVAIGAYLSLQGASNFIGDLVRVRGEFQQLEVAFNTMLGSKEKADKLMGQVVNLAATTPFTLQEVAGGAKQLLAYGFAAENVTDILRRMGDIAAGTGTDISGLVMTLGQVQNKGRLQAEEMMQFAERGVPIVQALADRFGVAKTEISKMVEAGKVGFDDVYAAIKGMTDQGGLFFNLMENQSHTLTGMVSNLSDAWSRMLNDMGKSQQGLFSGAIETATSLVNNYQKVLDILGVLVTMYGAYRAALIATTVAERLQQAAAVQNALAGGTLSKSMALQSAALVGLQRGWTGLKAAMVAAAPTAAMTAVFGALALSIYAVAQTSNAAAESQKNLKNVQAEGAKAAAEEKLQIEQLVAVMNDKTQSHEAQLAAIKKLREETGKTLQNYTDEEILAGKAKVALDEYTKAIYNNAVAKAAQGRISELTNQLADIEVKGMGAISTMDRLGESLKATFGFGDYSKVSYFDQLALSGEGTDKAILAQRKASIQKQIDDLKKTFAPQLQKLLLGEEGGTGGGTTTSNKRTVAIIDEEIKKLKEQQSAVSDNKAVWDEYQAKIKKLEEERLRITGASNAQLKSEEALQNKINDLLEQRKGILQGIADLQREAQRSVAPKELSEIDKINQKYDEQLLKIQKFNEKVDEFNKKRGTNVQKVGLLDITAVNEARVKQVGGEILGKQGADILKTDIDAVKGVFEQYGEAVKNIGVEKADAIFQEQTQGFSSFVDFLKAEAGKLSNQVNPQKMEVINKALQEAQKKQAEDDLKQRMQNFQNLIAFTVSYKDQETAIYRKYNEMEKSLEQNKAAFTVEQYQLAQQKINEGRENDLQNLRTAIAKEAPLIKKLGEDLFTFSKEDLRKRIRELKAGLAQGLKEGQIGDGKGGFINLTPAMIEAIQKAIEEAEQQAARFNSIFGISYDQLSKAEEKAGKLASTFSQMASAVRELNTDLGDGLQVLSQTFATVQQISGSLKEFETAKASGDVAGQAAALGGIVTAVVAAFATVAKMAKEIRAELDKTRQDMANFQNNIAKGEQEINLLYRQRLRDQERMNQLTLERIQNEKKLLEDQKLQNQTDYNKLLAELQQQSFTKRVTMQVGLNFWGLPKIETRDITESLAGKDFKQLEELFLKGQLTDKAKELFEALQKLKQEGIDIDKELEDLRKRAQEIFTGTTADGILDSIVDGFKQGKREAADFADNFEELMRGAMINSLKYQYLEGPLKDFFQSFADASQSDGQLTQTEIDSLKGMYNTIIQSASQQFDQLQQVAGLNFNSLNKGGGNNLSGAMRSLTESTGELLAAQFGGLRLTALDQLKVAQQGLQSLNAIQANTGLTVVRLESVVNELQDQTSRMRQWFTVEGIKVK